MEEGEGGGDVVDEIGLHLLESFPVETVHEKEELERNACGGCGHLFHNHLIWHSRVGGFCQQRVGEHLMAQEAAEKGEVDHRP